MQYKMFMPQSEWVCPESFPDLKSGEVKFVGDPNKRINEDYLRILRFLRFLRLVRFLRSFMWLVGGLGGCLAISVGRD